MEKLQEAILGRGALARLAEISGVDQATIGRIARGQIKSPGYHTVTKINQALEQLKKERLANTETEVAPAAETEAADAS